MKNAYFIPNVQYKAPKKIDPLRVSQSISKNMLNKDAYATGKDAESDIKLTNKDMEIHFGQDDENDPPAAQKETKVDLQTLDRNEVVDVTQTDKDKN